MRGFLKKAGSVYRKVKKEIVAEQLKFSDSHPLNLELASFIDCVRRGRRPFVSGKEGSEALQIVKKSDGVKNLHTFTHLPNSSD